MLAVLAGTMGLGAPALAAVPDGDQETSPEKLLDRGFERMEHLDFMGALSLFRRANGIKRSGKTLAQIGLAEQGLERWVNAEAHLMDGLAMAEDPWIGKRRKVLETALDTVRSHLADLMVRGNPVGAEVRLDDELVGFVPLRIPLRVIVGSRQLKVRLMGFHTWSEIVTFAPRASVEKTINLVAVAVAVGTGEAVVLRASPVAQDQERAPRAASPGWRWLGAGTIAAGASAVTVGAFWLWLHGKCANTGASAGAICFSTYDTHARGWAALGGGGVLMVLGMYTLAGSF